MNNRTYRGVPLPEDCTRSVLRKMASALKAGNNGYYYYTCNRYANIRAEKYDIALFRAIVYNKSLDSWQKFLRGLHIEVHGSGFRHWYLPDWFKELKGYSKENPDNQNRLLLIKDILKECYNE